MGNSQHNVKQLAGFSGYIAERKPVLKQQYEQLLAHDLSRQQWQGCFQRNVLAALASFYDDALRKIESLPFDTQQCDIVNNMSTLTPQVLAVFQGLSEEFLVFVIDKHRTSCALSNFLQEHKPDEDYVNDVKRDIAELWRNFALNANSHFVKIRC